MEIHQIIYPQHNTQWQWICCWSVTHGSLSSQNYFTHTHGYLIIDSYATICELRALFLYVYNGTCIHRLCVIFCLLVTSLSKL